MDNYDRIQSDLDGLYGSVVRLHERIDQAERKLERAKRSVSALITPRQYYTALIKERALPSCAQSYLDGLTQRLGNKHYRYIKQESIAKAAGKSLPTIKRGQKWLQDHGHIHVHHVYRPGARRCRKKSPTRTSSMVLFIGLSKLVASHIELRGFDSVPADKFIDAIKPSTRAAMGRKLPSEGEFLGIKNRVLKYQTDTNSFIDTSAVCQPPKSSSPGKKNSPPSSMDMEGNP